MTMADVTIITYPLTDLRVTNGTNTITVGNGITDTGSEYEFTCGSGNPLPCGTLTFSAKGYEDLTFNCYTDYSWHLALRKKAENLYAWSENIGNAYAWTVGSDVYYTESATPSVGDIIYNSNKQDSGKTISAVGDGYIEWTDSVDGILKGYARTRFGESPYIVYTIYDSDGTTVLGTYPSQKDNPIDYNVSVSPGQIIDCQLFDADLLWIDISTQDTHGITYEILESDWNKRKIRILTVDNNWQYSCIITY